MQQAGADGGIRDAIDQDEAAEVVILAEGLEDDRPPYPA
jgi:hypothetical protein